MLKIKMNLLIQKNVKIIRYLDNTIKYKKNLSKLIKNFLYNFLSLIILIFNKMMLLTFLLILLMVKIKIIKKFVYLLLLITLKFI